MIKFSIPEMNCDHCKAAIKNAVTALDFEARLEFDMNKRVVHVSCTNPLQDVLRTLKSEGYDDTVL